MSVTPIPPCDESIKAELPGGMADRLLAIGRDCAARLGAAYRALDHDARLYGENGPPFGSAG